MPHQPNILIVDDTIENLKILSQMLIEHKYEVRPAPSGELALKAAWSTPPDLFLLDIKMPHMDGYEVCQRLKRDDRTSEIPIIFISALDDVLDKVKAFQLGGADYITKPFEDREVITRIEHQLTICQLKQHLKNKNQLLEEALQTAKELNAVKSRYVSIISHEFQQPLANIVRKIEVLQSQEGQLTRSQKQEKLEQVKAIARNLLNLIEDGFNLSQIEKER